MNLRLFSAVIVVCLVGSGVFALRPDEPARSKSKSEEPPALDMLKEMKEWNSAKFSSPPTQFRQGHVKPRALDANAIAKTESGFEISLPSKAPIPTPTIYDGKLLVSGGFKSKEFYCFDAANGKFIWGIDLDDDGPTAAACDDGIAVFNTESCTIFAVEIATGKQLWSHWLGDPLTSTPTIAHGKVFTSYPARGGGGQQGQMPNNAQQAANAPPAKANPATDNAKPHPPCSHVLAALDLKTGKILWQRWIDSDVMSAPVAVDKELYATSFSGAVYKFDQADGTVLSAMKSRATSAPVVVGKNVYLTKRADDGKGNKVEESIAAVSRQTGGQNFEASKKEAVYLDGKVQVRSGQKAIGNQLDAGNGFAGGAPAAANPTAALWNIGQDNVCTMQAFQGSRLLHFSNRNFNCMGDEVICTDPNSGKEHWKLKLKGDLKKEGGALAAPPAAAGGHLFVVTLDGEVMQLDPVRGEKVKSYKLSSQTRFQPAIENGKIYVGTLDGKIICVDTGDARNTGWSCWGGNAAHTGLPRENGK
jgi:outer membrane protein assembly factor BamB